MSRHKSKKLFFSILIGLALCANIGANIYMTSSYDYSTPSAVVSSTTESTESPTFLPDLQALKVIVEKIADIVPAL